jgi:hypothetical protein
MTASPHRPVLLIGGSGVVGSQAARALRRLQPDLPITIGGRDPGRAEAIAREIGRADTARVDLERDDLGQPAGASYSAVVLFVKDDTGHALRYAQATGAAFVDISTGMFELAPEVALIIHHASAPVLLASHWLAGSAVLPALVFAREFRALDSIEIAALLDEEDMGGPAAYADYDRLTRVAASAQIYKDGKWVWLPGDLATRSFKDVDGHDVVGQAYSVLDIASLAATTDARTIRFDIAVGQSASRRRGEPFSTEIIIEMAGHRHDGPARVRHELVHPAGQAPLTALAVAVAVERLLGLAGGEPVPPGLTMPSSLIDPDTMVQRLREAGTRFRRFESAHQAAEVM